jgi:3-dehydroquinate synthetase
MKNGFAELIKTAVLFDPELFAALSPRPGLDALGPLVERCARWKEKVVAEDADGFTWKLPKHSTAVFLLEH